MHDPARDGDSALSFGSIAQTYWKIFSETLRNHPYRSVGFLGLQVVSTVLQLVVAGIAVSILYNLGVSEISIAGTDAADLAAESQSDEGFLDRARRFVGGLPLVLLGAMFVGLSVLGFLANFISSRFLIRIGKLSEKYNIRRALQRVADIDIMTAKRLREADQLNRAKLIEVMGGAARLSAMSSRIVLKASFSIIFFLLLLAVLGFMAPQVAGILTFIAALSMLPFSFFFRRGVKHAFDMINRQSGFGAAKSEMVARAMASSDGAGRNPGADIDADSRVTAYMDAFENRFLYQESSSFFVSLVTSTFFICTVFYFIFMSDSASVDISVIIFAIIIGNMTIQNFRSASGLGSSLARFYPQVRRYEEFLTNTGNARSRRIVSRRGQSPVPRVGWSATVSDGVMLNHRTKWFMGPGLTIGLVRLSDFNRLDVFEAMLAMGSESETFLRLLDSAVILPRDVERGAKLKDVVSANSGVYQDNFKSLVREVSAVYVKGETNKAEIEQREAIVDLLRSMHDPVPPSVRRAKELFALLRVLGAARFGSRMVLVPAVDWGAIDPARRVQIKLACKRHVFVIYDKTPRPHLRGVSSDLDFVVLSGRTRTIIESPSVLDQTVAEVMSHLKADEASRVSANDADDL